MPKIGQDNETVNKPLNAIQEFEKIREKYREQTKKRGFNCLLYGDFGTGKTFSLHTAPRPILVHSFDPGGSVTLRSWTSSGEIIVDASFESKENEKGNPSAYIDWEKEFTRLKRIGIFNEVGTYVIDSVTTMSESLMAAIMVRGYSKKEGQRKPYHPEIPTFIPQLQDYLIQQYTLADLLNDCCGLPCNFICTGHIDRDTDEVSGKVIATPMITGKYAQKIPLLFDEVYVADVSQTSAGHNYYFLTQSDGIYRARSRLAASGNIEKREPQDFKAILDKAGFNYKEKSYY